MERIPRWLLEYAKSFILENNYDSSHDLTHFINVVNYITQILHYEENNTFKLFENMSNEETERYKNIMYIAGFCHDLIDGKYVNPESSKEKLIELFKENNYPPEDLEVILFIIENMSFSKQRKSEQEEIKGIMWEKWGKYLDIVSDADKLDAYRVERVIAFQQHVCGEAQERAKSGSTETCELTKLQKNRNKGGDAEKIKGWIKTILLKRILEYKDKWLKTEYAKLIAPPLHNAVQEYVNVHLQDVEMFDY